MRRGIAALVTSAIGLSFDLDGIGDMYSVSAPLPRGGKHSGVRKARRAAKKRKNKARKK